MPTRNNTTDVIVIGGGAAGLSTAMQLAKRNASVIVLERQDFGNGSTGCAAGLLGQLRGTAEHTRMLIDSLKIVKQLERESKTEIFVRTGSFRIAETDERAKEIANLVRMGKSIGFDIDHVSANKVAQKLPYMRTDDLLDACYCPSDGHLNPAELVSAYIKIGKSHGVHYVSNCPVTDVLLSGATAKGVSTPKGDYYAPVIVNATGPWSNLIADLTDSVLPTAALGHYYLTTYPDAKQPIDPLSPAVRDRHHQIYARPKDGGLIVGMFANDTIEYDMGKLPIDFDLSTLKPGHNDTRVATLIHLAQQRFPWINRRTPMHVTTGIMTFTPDGNPFCGTLRDVDGLFHCAGFSGYGIVQSPVIGAVMTELILDGDSQYDIAAIEADRYYDAPGFVDRNDIKEKCFKMQGRYYSRLEGKEKVAS